MIIEEFGDREIYAATEHALERGMSLHEVIAIEMGTLTLPLEDAIALGARARHGASRLPRVRARSTSR